MLRYDQHVPENVRDGAPVVILLHGRGSHKGDMMGLQPYLLPEAIVVTPEAPFPSAPWGYGPGWAWYQIIVRNRPEPESFEASQQKLHTFLTELPLKLPVKPGPLILGGFSQGGTMSLGYSLRHPGAVQFVVNFSGFVPDHPSVQAIPASVKGTHIFWGHGTADPVIPLAIAVEGRGLLAQAGAALDAHDYPMGHGIEKTELKDVVAWLRRGLAISSMSGATPR
jgi:phospholipase/carboxylesterase